MAAETALGLPQLREQVLKPMIDMRLKACERLLDLLDVLNATPNQRTAILVYRGQVSLDLYLLEEAMSGQQGLEDWVRENFKMRADYLRHRLSYTDEIEQAYDAERGIETTP